MARYIIRAKITSSDPANTTFQAFEDPVAISIIQEFFADNRAITTDEIITADYRIIEISYTDHATYLELRSRLDALGNYKKNDVTVEVLSEGNED